jgi:hypothetical protein
MKQRRKAKFIQALDGKQLKVMEEQAKIRGIGLQEMIRAVVIPEWLAHQK